MSENVLANELSSSWLIGDDATYDPVYLQMAAQGQTFSKLLATMEVITLVVDLAQQTAPMTQISRWWAGPPCPRPDPMVLGCPRRFGIGTAPAKALTRAAAESAPTMPFPLQLGINMSNNMGSTNFRNIPDVALTADNIYVVADDGQAEDIGGTSAASPLWAAFCSLVNEKAALTGSATVGFIAPAIYAIAKGPLYST